MGVIVGVVMAGAFALLVIAAFVALGGDESERRAAPVLVLVAAVAAAIGFGLWAGAVAESRLGPIGIGVEVAP